MSDNTSSLDTTPHENVLGLVVPLAQRSSLQLGAANLNFGRIGIPAGITPCRSCWPEARKSVSDSTGIRVS